MYESINSFNMEKCSLLNYFNLILTRVVFCINQYCMVFCHGFNCPIGIFCNFCFWVANESDSGTYKSCFCFDFGRNCSVLELLEFFIFIGKYQCIIVTRSSKTKQKALVLWFIYDYHCRVYFFIFSKCILQL